MPKKSKKYVVRLTDAERETLRQIAGKFKGSSQKVRRAQMLLKSDADGPDWTDTKIAEAFGCQASIPCTRLLTQRKILIGCDGKDWTIRTEAEIQKFLRLQDPGLPLFPPYVPASGLPQDESAAEFGARGRAPSLLVSGKPLQDPERIIIASPEIIVRFSSPSPRVSIIAQSANPRETTKMRVELAGDTVFDAAAGADLVFGDDGGSEIKIGEPRLYHLLQNLPSKTREVTLRFPDALRTPLALYGVRFGN